MDFNSEKVRPILADVHFRNLWVHPSHSSTRRYLGLVCDPHFPVAPSPRQVQQSQWAIHSPVSFHSVAGFWGAWNPTSISGIHSEDCRCVTRFGRASLGSLQVICPCRLMHHILGTVFMIKANYKATALTWMWYSRTESSRMQAFGGFVFLRHSKSKCQVKHIAC